jgi:hypothetical protein
VRQVTRWKWDVDPKDPLVALRVPVTSADPVFDYIAVFDKESPHRPTNAEARLISSFIEEFKAYCFTEGGVADSLKDPFDTYLGSQPVVLHKYSINDWGYRRRHWQIGSKFTPPSPRVSRRAFGPLSLLGVLDLVQSSDCAHEQHWQQWKMDRPEVFGHASS